MAEIRKSYKFLVGKSKGERQLGIRRRRIILFERNIVCVCALDLSLYKTFAIKGSWV